MIDAKGKYVFPGFIDPHVHIYLPFMGTFAKDTHETASKAALVGGTTTFIEMICPARGDKPLEAFELWLGKAQGNSACDFTFHMGVTRYDEEGEAGFRRDRAARHRAASKCSSRTKARSASPTRSCNKTLRLAKKLGVITTAHCENADLVLELQKKLLREGKDRTGIALLEPAAAVEAEGVHHLMTFAEMTGAHVYTVHTSCEEALARSDARRDARRKSLGRNAHPISAARPHLRREAEFRGREERDVAAVARQDESGRALERASRRLRCHARDRPRAVRFRDAETDGRKTISRKSPTASRRSKTASISISPTA